MADTNWDVIAELTLLDKPRLKYNKEYARAVEDDISVLNWELKQKSDLLEGLRALTYLHWFSKWYTSQD